MKFAALLIACFVLLTVPGRSAQTGAEAKDPVTGQWGSVDGFTNLDLKFDGKSSVSGTTIWRAGDRSEHRAPIRIGAGEGEFTFKKQ